MKYRRSTFRTTLLGAMFLLCVTGSTKGADAFDTSNSTTDSEPSQQGDAERPSPSLKVLAEYGAPSHSDNSAPRGKCRFSQRGIASWYGGSFHGKKTASGEIFDQYANTVAHRTLPLGTRVSIENPRTGVIVYAKVNDRGPFIPGRTVDLSKGLADKLGISGTAPVELGVC